MKKKLIGIIILLLSITINVSAKEVSKNDIPNRTYVIGTHEFTRDPIDGNTFTGGYKGILETKYLMLGSTSINSNNIDDMIVYYKNPDGIWLNAATGEEIENVPDTFNIEYINTEVATSNTISNTIKKAIATNTTSTCNNLTVEEDGTTYLSGTKDCINFNYVWYSGKLWRITAINPDGSLKMITDDNITTISYGEDVNFYDISKKDDTSYTGSYIYQWLNEDFLDTLYNYKNIIVENSTWNITNSNAGSVDEISKKLPETTLINNSTIGKNTPVGLLNSYEYYLSYKNTNSTSASKKGYFDNGYSWWLLNSYSSSNVWEVGGADNFAGPLSILGVHPVVNLKPTIMILSGSGTKDDPYKILGDKEQPTINTTLLNTRTVGEYVIFDEDGSASTKEIYRIVGIEDGKVKLNKNDYIKSDGAVVTKKISTSITYGDGDSDEYCDYYLNNTWYNSLASIDMLDKGTYYIKERSSGSYKNSLCNTDDTTETTKSCVKTTSIWNSGYVGLPRLGEMFASQQEDGRNNSNTIWLITPYSSSNVWHVDGNNIGYYYNPSLIAAVRPSIYLKSNVVITGGDGTKTNPFTIALK